MSMGAKKKEYDVTFVYHNFNAGDIRPMKVLGEIKDDYVELHRAYEYMLNDSVEELNELWKKSHPHEEGDDYDEDEEAVEYGYFLQDSLNVLATMVNLIHPDNLLLAYVYHGKEGPEFACRIKQHPTLWMTHVKKA
jgi:hypothetical protein